MTKIIHSLFISLALIASSTATAEIDTSKATAHPMDTNGDGVKDEKFYQGRLDVILIPMDDILIPIVKKPAIYGELQTNTTSVIKEFNASTNPSEAVMENNSLVHIADFDGDKKDDILLQGKSSTGKIYLLLSSNSYSANLPIYVPVPAPVYEWSNGYFGLDWTADKVKLQVGDVNGDGLADIILNTDSAKITLYAETGGKFTQGIGVVEYIDAANIYSHRSGTIVAGQTKGSFKVDSSGAATYTIPIAVPPGMRGMQPNLKLHYNSRNGNGLLGMGWQLKGLSTIHRCPQTFVHDGKRKGVTYDTTDRLCLDGKRLVVTNGTTYGSAGAEYRTEMDGFLRISQYGGDTASGNTWFMVKTKANQTFYYGNTPDSQIKIPIKQGSHTWAVKSIGDTYGNTVTVNYDNLKFYGNHILQYRINDIVYRSINGESASVRFTYEGRPDDLISLNGGRVTTDIRIAAIETYVGNHFNRSIELYYETGTAKRSRITRVQECSYDGTCLPEIKFTLSDDTKEFISASVGAGKLIDVRYQFVGDFNGDGLSDYMTVADFEWYVRYGQRDGSLTAPTLWLGKAQTPVDVTPYPNPSTKERQFIGDFDGDGRTDYMWEHNSEWYVALSKPSGVVVDKWLKTGDAGEGIAIINDTEHHFIGDYNGDGRSDYMWSADYEWYVALSTGSGFTVDKWFATNDAGSGIAIYNLTGHHYVADFNGDGMTDYMWNANYEWYVAISNGSGFEKAKVWLCNTCGPSGTKSYHSNAYTNGNKIGDFNGDGLMDYAWDVSYEGWAVALSNGDGFENGVIWIKKSVYPFADELPDSTIRFVRDINGDGLTDLMYFNNRNLYYNFIGGWYVALSNGKGFDTPTNWLCEGCRGTGVTTNINRMHLGDFNGDAKIDYLWLYDYDTYIAFNSAEASAPPDLIKGITDGIGNNLSIDYKPLSDSTIYNKSGCLNDSYPVRCMGASLYVVADYSASNGIGTTNKYTFKYEDLRAHIRGRGLLGFGGIEKHDLTNDVREVTQFNTTVANIFGDAYPDTYFYRGMFDSRDTYINNKLITSISNTPGYSFTTTTNKTWFPYISQSVKTEYDEKTGDKLKVITTNKQYNEASQPYQPKIHGNLTYQKVSTLDWQTQERFEQESTNNYIYDNDDRWGLVSDTTVTSSITALDGSNSSVPAITRNTEYTYNVNDVVETVTVEPGDPSLELLTTYSYGTYGNKEKVTVENSATSYPVARRETTSTLHANGGLYPEIVTTNAETHSETKVLDARHGGTVTLIGPNGLPTSWTYDGFGRKDTETRADGTVTQFIYNLCVGCIANSAYTIETLNSGSAPVKVYYDMLGREIRTETKDVNDQTVLSDTHYNAKGETTQVSIPYFAAAAPDWTYYTYDELGRPHCEKAETGTVKINNYDGLKVEEHLYKDRPAANCDTFDTTQLADQKTIKGYYANGKLRQVTDAEDGITTYYYDAVGNLTQTHAPAKNPGAHGTTNFVRTTIGYDGKGRNKTAMIDPDMGSWSYAHDALGQLRQQTDAKGNTVNINYDLLGRMVYRSEPEGVSEWFYDTATNGIGKLDYMTGPFDAVNNYNPFKRQYSYDEFGRNDAIETTIKELDNTTTPASIKTKQFRLDTSYDAYSRIDSVTYPAINAQQRLVVRNNYDPNNYGNLIRVERELYQTITDGAGNPVTGVVAGTLGMVWQLGDGTGYSNAVNARGQVLTETVGNNISTTNSYDATGRLTDRLAGGGAIQDMNFVYDSLGNLEQRTDRLPNPSNLQRSPLVEVYTYDSLNRLKSASLMGLPAQVAPSVTSFEYEASGNIRYKSDVGYYWYETSHKHAVSRLSSDNLGSTTTTSYPYDSNGNMKGGDGRTINYTSFNKPASISKAGTTITFDYDAEYGRYRQVGPDKTIYYLNARYDDGTHFEQEVTASATQNVHHLYAGSTHIGTYTIDQNTNTKEQYFHKDHLGSVSVITDGDGVVRAKVGYTAFGERLDNLANIIELNGVIDMVTGVKLDNHHWYTSHEHIELTGIIHMNGRIYDPRLGRFMSPDTLVPEPEAGQSFNRYSYVNNNPLSFTDPSGHEAYDPNYNASTADPYGFNNMPSTGIDFTLDSSGGGMDSDFGYYMDTGGMFDTNSFGAPVVDSIGISLSEEGASVTMMSGIGQKVENYANSLNFFTTNLRAILVYQSASLVLGTNLSTRDYFDEGCDACRPVGLQTSASPLEVVAGGAVLGGSVTSLTRSVVNRTIIAGRYGTTAERTQLLENVISADGRLNASQTVARQLAGPRNYIPHQSVLDTIGSGARIADPQRVAGQFMYRAPAEFVRDGKLSTGTLEVLVHELSGQVRHVLYRSSK